MDWSESRKLILLVLVALAIMAAARLDLLSPKGMQSFQVRLGVWWAGNHVRVWIGLASITLILSSFFAFKWWRKIQHAREIQQRVANGATIQLLGRSDWKPVDPANVNLWARLADALPHDEHISFEIGGSDTELFFALHGSEDGVRAALTQFKAEWPGMQRRPVEVEHAQVPPDWHLHWIELCPQDWKESITSLSSDPLRAVLVEVNGVLGRGRGLVQVIARNDFGTRAKLGRAAFENRAEKVENAGVKAIRTKEARGLETRAERTFLQVTVRCVGIADSQSRAQGIARGLARAVSASYGHRNPVKPVKNGSDPQVVMERRMGKTQAWADDELASLAHLTGSDMLFVAPRLKTASAKSLPPDPEMRVTVQDGTARFVEAA